MRLRYKNNGSSPNLPIITIRHRAAKAPIRRMMHTFLAVAPVPARRYIAEIKVHTQGHDQILHGRNDYADLGALDQRIAPQVPVHDSLQGGDVLAYEKKAQIMISRNNKTVQEIRAILENIKHG